MKNRSVEFFDQQFQRQVAEDDFSLNPFETAILPFLSGDILDLGCGLGNLAVAAARRGFRVTALDASPTAVDHLRRRAAEEKLPITVLEADLKETDIRGEFDCVVAIGLLMFFPREVAREALTKIKSLVKPGGLAAVNVLTEGTTFMDMFDPTGYCLFGENELPEAFVGWAMEYSKFESFGAPKDTVKRFCTLVARRPGKKLPAFSSHSVGTSMRRIGASGGEPYTVARSSPFGNSAVSYLGRIRDNSSDDGPAIRAPKETVKDRTSHPGTLQ